MSTGLIVNTAKVPDRRDLAFQSMDDIEADMDRILAAEREGRLRQLGNWTPGQVFWHVGEVMRGSFDGVPFGCPWFVKLFRPIFRKMVLGGAKPFQAGYQLRGESTAILPSPEITTQQGADVLRSQLARIKRGEQMTQTSPFLGPMTHEDWLTLHRKHASLHFSFLKPE